MIRRAALSLSKSTKKEGFISLMGQSRLIEIEGIQKLDCLYAGLIIMPHVAV